MTRPASSFVMTLLLVLASSTGGRSATGDDVQERMDLDLIEGKPIVVHVVVALCDNEHQGIVPVSAQLGNGQQPGSNLYWGALYGVRTFFSKQADWESLTARKPADESILARAVFHARASRRGERVPVYLVADAWDGARIRAAMGAYLDMVAGARVERVRVKQGATDQEIDVGGAAHLVVYVGHNGLMDFTLSPPRAPRGERPARSAAALACASQPYLHGMLNSLDAHPLLLTTGLMAPEAYTLDAAIRAWVNAEGTPGVLEAAAGAYHRYQKCGMGAARRLFWGAP